MIRLAGVDKSYGRGAVIAVRGATLEIAAGSLVVITGPSGSGKTTLLNLIGGLTRPDRGTVSLFGRDLLSMSDREFSALRGRRIGIVHQFPSLLPHLSILDNARLQLSFAGRPDNPAAVRALLAAAGLAGRETARAAELSAGQQRRAAVVRALAHAPELILADEPTGDLDAESEAAIMSLLGSAHGRGATVVMSTHHAGLSSRAQRRLVMAAGELREDPAARPESGK